MTSSKPIGLTLVTDQGVYLEDDFNTTDWIPTAVISDHLTYLSNAWVDDNYSTASRSSRTASSTTMNAAFMSGQWLNAIGKHLEDWNGTTFTLDTSFVLLYEPRHSLAVRTGKNTYRAPTRVFDFDERFARASCRR